MLALNRALHSAVLQLHAGNRREASQVMKCLRPRYDPGRDVRQPNVQDLTGADCIIHGSLDLFHGGSEVPPMHIIKVDIIKAEALEAGVESAGQSLAMHASSIGRESCRASVCQNVSL